VAVLVNGSRLRLSGGRLSPDEKKNLGLLPVAGGIVLGGTTRRRT